MKTNLIALLFIFLLIDGLKAEKMVIKRVEPMNWWVGMKNPKLQILVYGEGIGYYTPSVNYEGVCIDKVIKTENENYLFIDLNISSDSKAGKVPILFSKGKSQLIYEYPLLKRRTDADVKPNFSGSDNIYLITPDRFSNGDRSNDNVKGYNDLMNRKIEYGRHGGDIQGVMDHVDYIKNLGMTALWLNPVCENNQDAYTYHGYAISDFYHVDPRYGDNQLYQQLADKLHSNGLKFIQDIVFNHCGSAHWWMKDLPAKNWINDLSNGRSVFQNSIVSDMHASVFDTNKQVKGYFDTNMPDLNYDNDLLATYMIQHTIWWVEFANLDGLRIDTYPYADKMFLKKWRQLIEIEYPGIYVVVEVWVHDVAYAAYWNSNGTFTDKYDSGITSITDFPVYYKMLEAFKKDGDVWNAYHVIAKDFLYAQPQNNLVFFDNHDVARSYAELGYDMNQFKLGVTFTLTTRGILQWYYGSEIAMEQSDGHGVIREDMPGGWMGDSIDVFKKENLSDQQTEALEFTSYLLNWRKNSPAIDHGKLIHFIPENNCYVYFRVANEQTIMIVLNNGNANEVIELDKYAEILESFTTVKNVLNGQKFSLSGHLSILGKTAYVFELE